MQLDERIKNILKIAVFQSLIGRLATAAQPGQCAPVPRFQSLIGRLATHTPALGSWDGWEFQSLIGRLATSRKEVRT